MPAQHTSITKGLIPLYYLQYVMHTTGEHYNVCKLTGFILVDIGEVGRHSDGGGILSNSCFGQALESQALSIPEACALAGVCDIRVLVNKFF